MGGKKVSANLEAKKQVVEEIKAKISASKSVVLVDYKGLTVAEATELRNAFRKANVEYKVLKNTLVRRAFNELGVSNFDADLNGATAVAFGSDETGASKIVVENAKKLNDKLSAKAHTLTANTLTKMVLKHSLQFLRKMHFTACSQARFRTSFVAWLLRLTELPKRWANNKYVLKNI